MAARHRQNDPAERDQPATPPAAEQPPRPAAPAVHPLLQAGIERHLSLLRLVMAAVNAVTAVALGVNRAGSSPAFNLLQQYAPLRIWMLGFATVALLLMGALLGFRTATVGHLLAVVLWAVPAVGAVFGLLTGTTTSPTASITLAALIVGMATHHALALLFLRRMARPGR